MACFKGKHRPLTSISSKQTVFIKVLSSQWNEKPIDKIMKKK